MFPIKCTVFFSTVTVLKNTVRLIGNIRVGPTSIPEYRVCLIIPFGRRDFFYKCKKENHINQKELSDVNKTYIDIGKRQM